MRFGYSSVRKLVFPAFIVKQLCIIIQKMSQAERSAPYCSSVNSHMDILKTLTADFFLVLVQILGLVFSMTMFCQAVKVETFYA